MKVGRFLLTVVVILSFSLNVVFYLSGTIRTFASYSRQSTGLEGPVPGRNETESGFNKKSPYPINHPETCSGDLDLIIVVCSGLGNFQSREFVRKSWGSYSKQEFLKTRLLFLVGLGDDATLEKVRKENRIHGDLIVGNFVDTYRNLTLKSISVLKWITTYCANAKYGLKADDDVFVNVPNLINALDVKRRKVEKFIIGSKQVGAKPIQDKNSKWYTPREEFGEKVYPPYVSGTAYAFTLPAAVSLYSVTHEMKPFWLEDIYITGLCARAAGIPRFDHGGFTFQRRNPTGCAFKHSISGHYLTGEEMLKIYNDLLNVNLKCDTA